MCKYNILFSAYNTYTNSVVRVNSFCRVIFIVMENLEIRRRRCEERIAATKSHIFRVTDGIRIRVYVLNL